MWSGDFRGGLNSIPAVPTNPAAEKGKRAGTSGPFFYKLDYNKPRCLILVYRLLTEHCQAAWILLGMKIIPQWRMPHHWCSPSPITHLTFCSSTQQVGLSPTGHKTAILSVPKHGNTHQNAPKRRLGKGRESMC